MTEEHLYSDGRISIIYFPKRDVHALLMDDYGIILDHGILEELSKTTPSEIRTKLDTLDPSFISMKWTKGRPLSSEHIGLAIAQARIRELERRLDSLQPIIQDQISKILADQNPFG